MLQLQRYVRTKGRAVIESHPTSEQQQSGAQDEARTTSFSLSASRLTLFTVPAWLLLLGLAFSLQTMTGAAVVAVAGILFYAAQVLIANEQARLDYDVQLGRIRREVKRRIDDLSLAEVGFSRRYLETRIEQEVKRSQRYRLPLTLVVLRTNVETVTTDGVEDVAADIISTASRLLRTEDVLGQLGNDEYAFILPHTNRDQAGIVVRRLETALADCYPEFGVAQLSAGVSTTEALIDTARGNLEARSRRDLLGKLPTPETKAA